ncbi:glycosyltransferase [Aerococcus urinaeequi]|uniref:Glycosyltransferase n=1 Tax=Aerococcus urinaeequi TaxID=51665 RepID=A0AAE9XNL1_9LACT|nr:glycosyltransferase [Aerococcus urinaeequi]WCG37235.1 glycosyltransferase [Aerococcus urinaeequi]
MNNSIKISIIMPVYNVENYLEKSIQSILNQNFPYWELIVVNDGSTDSSKEILIDFSSRFEEIIYLEQENLGSGIARQNGLDIASGDYICFVDPDDFLGEKAFVSNLPYIVKYKPDMVINGYFKENNRGKKEVVPLINGFFNQDEIRNNYIDITNTGERVLWNKLYRADFIRRHDIRFTSQRVGQDALFNFEVYKYIEKIYVNPIAFYHYNAKRNGSAIRSYRTDRKELEYNIAVSYEKMFEFWNRENDYLRYIYESYWNVYFRELINIARNDNHLQQSKKLSMLKIMRDEEHLELIFENLGVKKINSNFSRLVFILYKYKKNTILLILLNFVINKVI